MNEVELRSQFVAEALTWVGTPYREAGHVKGKGVGSGVDCATFIAECLIACGLASRDELKIYGSHEWWVHHPERKLYMIGVMRQAALVIEGVAWRSLKAQPGDIVLAKVATGRAYNHGGIVVEWPKIVHAMLPIVSVCDATRDPRWAGQAIMVFDPFAKLAAPDPGTPETAIPPARPLSLDSAMGPRGDGA
jgi:cell wall-associated NlpC family hydrolase